MSSSTYPANACEFNPARPSCRLSFLTIAVAAGALALSGAHLSAAPDDALIAQARRTLYTNRDESIAVLEEAIKRHPEEVAYWVEFIHALDVNGDYSFADRASRRALASHPRHPDLLIARARLDHDGVGLEILADLAKLPGYQRQAQRLSDVTTCGLFFPETDPWPLGTLTGLADRLLAIGRARDAAGYLDEALSSAADKSARPLLARRAMLAALDGDFERAMKLHASAGGVQVVVEDAYYGLADVLLVKNRADLAIKSFGDRFVAEKPLRRLLAIARSRSGHAAGALKLLNGDAMEDQLLRCRVLLSAGREDEAKSLGRQIVAPMKITEGSYHGPRILCVFAGPRALVDDYLFVARWLNEQFPEKRPEIQFVLGRGTEEPRRTPLTWSPVEPISQTIRRLEAAMRNPGGAEDPEVRWELSHAYEQAGRYNDAAELLTTLPLTDPGGNISYTWARWSMLRRQAEALAASEKDYASLAAARPIIANIRASRWNHPKVKGQPWLGDQEVAKRLIAVGPAVLADVMTQLAPNTISGEDRRPWVAVIEQLGSARDSPALIATLALVTRPERHPSPSQDENDRLSAAAIETCLRKLTGANPEGADRARAWSKWWAENAGQIVAGK